MKTLKSTQISSKKRLATTAILAAALLSVGYFGYAYSTKSVWPFTMQQSNTPKALEKGINYSPPTQEEVDESQDVKKQASDSASNTSSSAKVDGAKRAISVGVSYAGVTDNKLEIRAFVDGVIEGNGTCTATMTNGSQTISMSSRAFIDASSSICEPIQQDVSNLNPGQWQIVVTYSSPDAQGASDKVMVAI